MATALSKERRIFYLFTNFTCFLRVYMCIFLFEPVILLAHFCEICDVINIASLLISEDSIHSCTRSPRGLRPMPHNGSRRFFDFWSRQGE